jgi:hypothetical protein
MNPRFGQGSLGALIGAVVGAIGGLFAVGIAPAILAHEPALLFAARKLGLICWLISGLMGWLLGGQFGPRFGNRFRTRSAEITGGVMGGLIPIVLIALWGWYLVAPR